MTTEYRDLLERLVATFVETFLAALVITDLSTAATAATAGVAAVLAGVKAAAKQRLTGR